MSMNLAMVEAIGQLDYILSRLILMSEQDLDQINHKTMKHHAEDMEGAAKKIMENLEKQKQRHPEWSRSQPVPIIGGLSKEQMEEIDQTP